MSHDISFEHPEFVFFATIRTICSRLWFINNPALEERILAYLARYVERHGVTLYYFVLMGNHYHLIARFSRGNKAAFFRDLNSIIAKLTNGKVEVFEGGRLWARRVRTQVLPNNADIEERFFYAALNPVGAGLVKRISDYRAYNAFSDSVLNRKRKFKVVDWDDYNNRKRFNASLTIAQCTSVHTLAYTRLPGYEALSKQEYVSMMFRKLEQRNNILIEERAKKGVGFASPAALLKQAPGSKPRTTKTAGRRTPRPLVLTSCRDTRKRFLDWYFSLLASFRIASQKFRQGKIRTVFPYGTYRPTAFCGLA